MNWRMCCILFLVILTGCTNTDLTVETVEKQGFTDVEITGWSPLACSEDDFYETGFSAVNSQGVRVEGTVCCGFFFKSCTVRW